MSNFKFIFLFALSTQIVYGQDSLIVYQKDASLFSNIYIFYSNGTFKHFYQTDDLQTWYGRGNFSDIKNERVLKFGIPDTLSKDYGKVHYESNFKRKLVIKGNSFISNDYYFTTKKKKVIFLTK